MSQTSFEMIGREVGSGVVGKQVPGSRNMPHQTPLDAIAAAIERANIDFPNSGGGTWPHTYRPMEECCHLAQAVISGLEKWGYAIVPSVK